MGHPVFIPIKRVCVCGGAHRCAFLEVAKANRFGVGVGVEKRLVLHMRDKFSFS